MKRRHSFLLLCFVANCTISQPVFAQYQSGDSSELTVGDHAPELKIETWIKGGGFIPLEKNRVYLIDLWAVWCVPCIAGIPRLSVLQAKYKTKGLEIIGITSEDKYGNTLANVKEFVGKKDTAMNYSVAWVPVSKKDSEQGIWLHQWMQKSRSGNLPTSFLVDRNGKVVYIGDPSTIDNTLDAVMNDDYDMAGLKTDYLSGRKAEKELTQFNAAIKEKNFTAAIDYGRHLLSDFTYVKPNTYLVMGWQVSHIDGEIKPGLLQVGYEAAIRGVKLTKFSSPGFLDVLAAIHAVKKDYVSAIIAEKLAISLSEGEMKIGQTKNLEKYLSFLPGTDD